MDYDYAFKLVICGNTGTGKTSIIKTYTENYFQDFPSPTIGIDFGSKIIKLNNDKKIKLCCWDTSGQEQFNTIVRSYFRNIACAIIVYDITNRHSFNNLHYWYKELKENNLCTGHKHKILLLGTHKDNEHKRQVSYIEGSNFALDHNFIFNEVKSQDEIEITKVMKEFAEVCYMCSPRSCLGIHIQNQQMDRLYFEQGRKESQSSEAVSEKNCCIIS